MGKKTRGEGQTDDQALHCRQSVLPQSGWIGKNVLTRRLRDDVERGLKSLQVTSVARELKICP